MVSGVDDIFHIPSVILVISRLRVVTLTASFETSIGLSLPVSAHELISSAQKRYPNI